MTKPNVTKWLKSVKTSAIKHSPEILTGIGIAGMITSTVLAVKATPKALKLIEEAEREKYNEYHDDGGFSRGKETLTPIETVKAAWKPYIPATITCAVSVGCLIGGSRVSAKRNAALATAYQLSTTALNEYKEAIIETVEEEKVKEINDKVAQKQLDRNPVDINDIPEPTPSPQLDNTYLCYDAGGNQYFRSNQNRIESAINDLNWSLSHGIPYVSLDELYSALNIETTELSRNIGWNLYRDELIEVTFSEGRAANGEPCLVVSYANPPKYDYYSH